MKPQTLTLPWPTANASPNARVHWSKKAAAMVLQKKDAFYIAKEANLWTSGKPHIELKFCPPDARRRDMDNMLASIKGFLDGLSKAWNIDDCHFQLTLVRGDIIKKGAVVVTLLE